uniref:Protein tweety homolog n=1 Tax=Anopheles merus TaxID=30066 RepID=A0A182VG33_ANOME
MGYLGMAEDDDQYRVPLIAKLLHALPHYNITFHRINNTFRPSNDVYLESLGILGSIPAALLIVSLFGLLLYLLTRCCDRKPRPAHSITSLKVTLSIVTVLCCAAIGLGLYGNDDLHNGLLEVLQAGRKVDGVVSSVRNQTFILENTLTMKIQQQLTELEDIFDQKTNNQTALAQLQQALLTAKGNITIAKNAANDIRRPLVGLTITDFLTKGDQWELIRWPGTVAILALLLVLCAVLLVGVARHSRCALILFSVCGLLAVTGSWLMSGLYLSTSVAVGDLCNDPADFLVHQAPHELPADILLYYTQCDISRSNPFTQRLRESQNAINNARNAMSTVSKISPVLFKNAGLAPKLGSVNADIKLCERLLTGLTALVDCRAVHYSYLVATRGLCECGLLGLVLMLIASFMAAILLTIMVWVDSHTWIYIRKRNDYAQVEEQSYVSHQLHPQSHPNMNTRTLPHHPKGSTPGYSSKPLPSIINCPLPDIPKGVAGAAPTSKDDIYVKRKLLTDHPNGSKFATLKPIPAPKIEPNGLNGKHTGADLAAQQQLPPPPPPPPLPVTGGSSGSSGGSSSGYGTAGLTTSQIQSLPLPPPPLELQSDPDDPGLRLPPPPTSEELLESGAAGQPNGDGVPNGADTSALADKPGHDENSFYAVTEL